MGLIPEHERFIESLKHLRAALHDVRVEQSLYELGRELRWRRIVSSARN